MNKKIVHDALILTAFTVVLGFVLGLVYGITKEPIAAADTAKALNSASPKKKAAAAGKSMKPPSIITSHPITFTTMGKLTDLLSFFFII